ncbi:gamma-glutamylcyclotransferase [Virgibacillus xinjiangensis]|uniref:Gamma-glutamylcyclotransferase n=1 Tax=Virgibacillus xinjiangensis TaxID=393090 RepID=A0ABV7CR29_9BACI
MHRLFVYGRLRRGEELHERLKGADCVSLHAWVYGKLEDTGNGWPLLKEDPLQRVYGEMYKVTIDQLQTIRTDSSIGGLIEWTAYNDRAQSFEVIVPLYKDAVRETARSIPLGDWKVYRYLMREDLFYFAYGSCMDDERFKLAKVDQHFNDSIGKALLHNHGFRLSRSSNDGGKADIIESFGEQVEGIVYKVPMEAIDYLYQREGVYSNAYRPAVVQVELKSGQIVDTLTFIGMEKQKETAPTPKYAEEILRGAEGILSGGYIDGLRRRLLNLLNKG